MKVRENYPDAITNDIIEVTDANYLVDYKISVTFNDGSKRAVNFKPFLIKSLHPSISKYLDENLFKNFEIKNGNLNWNDYDLIFPVNDLHEGEIK